MTRAGIAAMVVAGLCQVAAAGEISSAYTDIDADKTCSIFSTNEEGGEFANLACNGWRGYPVLIYSGDLRESVFYGFPPAGDLAPAWESFSAFNSTGPRIEWRIETDGSRSVPFAAIHRWFVSADPENPDRQTEQDCRQAGAEFRLRRRPAGGCRGFGAGLQPQRELTTSFRARCRRRSSFWPSRNRTSRRS